MGLKAQERTLLFLKLHVVCHTVHIMSPPLCIRCRRQILIGFERGLIVLWNVKQADVQHAFISLQVSLPNCADVLTHSPRQLAGFCNVYTASRFDIFLRVLTL